VSARWDTASGRVRLDPAAPAGGARARRAFALWRQGRLDDVEGEARALLEADPRHAQALNLLGMVAFDRGDTAAAIAHFRAALAVRPDATDTLSNLGVALARAGGHAEAARCYRRALEIDPRFAEAHNNLGLALEETGDVAGAIAAYRRAVALRPRYAEAWVNLGTALRDRREPAAARDAFERALALDARRADAHNGVGVTWWDEGDVAAALACYRRALECDPRHARAWANQGNAQMALGEIETARASLERALAIDPDLAEAHHHLALAGRGRATADTVADLEHRLARPDTPARDAMHLRYACAKLLDDLGEHDRAFAHLRRANATRKRSMPFDRAAHARLVDALVQTFPALDGDGREGTGRAGEWLVLVIGMPRSGTSLVEQILASHPEVHGGGEGRFLVNEEAALRRRLGARYPYALPAMDEAARADLAARYRASFGAPARQAARVTDKMPDNFLRLGLVDLALPRARVVHCARDPLDTCLSIYFQHFVGGNAYAYDLGDIGVFYRGYRRLMDHWRARLGERLLEVRYERLVEAPESESRRLVEFLGLPWSDACLAYGTHPRPVLTASVWQVRQPVYASSVGRARRYARHLGPLRDALGDTLGDTLEAPAG